ncbi:MAG: hypothetical protein V3581_02640 [Candidatus Cardinium sp.]|uniref:hypothetical protein n=1 Tax=Candidatus Cardinium sp. TP TaxID=2961955 RepID=UPI0021AFFF2E|nr:hypothetical protein [Candidatus Cardinium sp. TP]
MSCHSSYLGSHSHAHKPLGCSCNASLPQSTPSTQPISEHVNNFTNKFKEEAIGYLLEYIELNRDKNKYDTVAQDEEVLRLLCHLLVRDHHIVHLMQSGVSELDPGAYIALRNKLFLTVYPDFMARHGFPEQ